MGILDAIYTKRAHRGPMDRTDTAVLTAGAGLAGSADRGGRRQVTLLDADRWATLTAALTRGDPIDPAARRANLVVSGVELARTRGRTLRVGSCVLRIWMHTAPCERMDEVWPGLAAALRPDWGGGACAEVVVGGEIRVGDVVRFAEDADA